MFADISIQLSQANAVVRQESGENLHFFVEAPNERIFVEFCTKHLL
jgi:hypothetical protein